MIGTKASGSGKRTAWLAALLALVLLWPAILNGLPHFFPDSGGYLKVGWGRYWLSDRSSFYGLYLKPFVSVGGIAGLWLGLLPQLVATVLLPLATARRMEAPHWPLAWLAVLALSTGPWHASQLMPDAYAVPIVLLGWLGANRDPGAPGSPLLWLAAAALCLTHSTYPALLVASCLAALAALKLGGLAWRALLTRLAALGVALLFVVGIQFVANAFYFHKATYAPRSEAFLFASLHEDGIVQPWLARHCPTDPRVRELCAIAPRFPRDSQQLLWSPQSVFWDTVWEQSNRRGGIDWDRQLGIAARGALAEHPLLFARAAIDATGEQFLSYRVLDDECPATCNNPRSALQDAFHEFEPGLRDRVNATRQVRGELRTYPLLAVTGLVSSIGLLGLFVLPALAWRRRDALAGSLLLATLAALLANAFVTGTLSDVHDRYQSRVIWLAPVVCVLVLLRWRAARGRGPAPA
ncbi:hypothetical protein [Sphingomonas astaxanthinifaciens]|uniref:Uncharacterized protein n=1 Tax=Sphingomonas astaxanthinifaciens DSM 22298 TaxID=1123267 RepID=A0ABQ5Z508_9SPHN|nr:hypothetical protein [Sphingomonas astaxanthinifaciens]GLR47091.1 hypothetical protein GCM10007925_08020 [Sphingomonas astaxanthinifaciens DSM 22298]